MVLCVVPWDGVCKYYQPLTWFSSFITRAQTLVHLYTITSSHLPQYFRRLSWSLVMWRRHYIFSIQYIAIQKGSARIVGRVIPYTFLWIAFFQRFGGRSKYLSSGVPNSCGVFEVSIHLYALYLSALDINVIDGKWEGVIFFPHSLTPLHHATSRLCRLFRLHASLTLVIQKNLAIGTLFVKSNYK